MTALDEQAKRVLALFGKHPKRVVPSVGDEQEYFLIKKDAYRKRRDLVICGRTLFGAAPCKGQELEEHYFGAIRPTVSAYMKDLDNELWHWASRPRRSTTRWRRASTNSRPCIPSSTRPLTTTSS